MAAYFYIDANSGIHRLHPITKIICLAALFGLLLVFNHPLYLLGIGGLIVCLGLYARCLKNVLRIYKLMLVLFVVSVILWVIFRGGKEPLFRLGPVTVYKEAILFGAGMGIRLNLMLLCGLIFFSATKVEDFTAGLNKMGLPFSVSFACGLAFRLLPMFIESAHTIVQAQRCRGLDVTSGNIVERIRKYVPLLVPVFMGAVRSADNLAIALESKGFGGRQRRTYYQGYSFGIFDVVAVGFLGLLTFASVALRLKGFGAV